MHLVQTFGLTQLNWSGQMVIVKRLLKTYTKEQLLYAIDYYAKKGVHIYSIGFLNTKTMKDPINDMQAVNEIKQWSDDSGTRNQRKFAENNKVGSRKKHYFDLFEEPGQDN